MYLFLCLKVGSASMEKVALKLLLSMLRLPINISAVLKSSRPSLLLKKFFLPLRLSCKESSTFSPSPSSSGSGDVTALLGARNRYALRLADQSGLRQFLRDGTA